MSKPARITRTSGSLCERTERRPRHRVAIITALAALATGGCALQPVSMPMADQELGSALQAAGLDNVWHAVGSQTVGGRHGWYVFAFAPPQQHEGDICLSRVEGFAARDEADAWQIGLRQQEWRFAYGNCANLGPADFRLVLGEADAPQVAKAAAELRAAAPPMGGHARIDSEDAAVAAAFATLTADDLVALQPRPDGGWNAVFSAAGLQPALLGVRLVERSEPPRLRIHHQTQPVSLKPSTQRGH